MIDFRIKTFIEVCRYMNYTKASLELHITQPAVSQHIHYLEQLYNVKLFTYEGRKMELSPAGRLLLQKCTALINDEEELRKSMQSCAPGKMPLVFGVTTTIGEFAIANPLSQYIAAHPDVLIRMYMGNTNELLQSLRDGNINFALIEGYFSSDEFDSMTFSREIFIPVCNSSHKFKTEPSVLTDLLGERLLLREPGSGTRNILERYLSAKNISIHDFCHTTELGSMTAIIQLIRNDCGITFLYQTAAQPELEKGVLRQINISDFQMTHDFSLIWNRGSLFASEYQNICKELQSYY